jgi:carboxylesterase type B
VLTERATTCDGLQGKATDMMEDVNTGIAWVLEMCQYYGGDPGRVHLVGQSAGAQLLGLAIISQVRKSRTLVFASLPFFLSA